MTFHLSFRMDVFVRRFSRTDRRRIRQRRRTLHGDPSVAVPVGDPTAVRLRARLIRRINNLRVGLAWTPRRTTAPLVTEAALARVRLYRPN